MTDFLSFLLSIALEKLGVNVNKFKERTYFPRVTGNIQRVIYLSFQKCKVDSLPFRVLIGLLHEIVSMQVFYFKCGLNGLNEFL